MLKLRVITGLVLAILLAIIVFLMPPLVYLAAMAFVILAAAWEWTTLSGVSSLIARVAIVLVIAVLMGVVHYLPLLQPILIFMSLPWWILVFRLVLSYPEGTALWAGSSRMLLAGLFVILPAWSALLLIRARPEFHFLFTLMVVLIAFTDIGAYFFGRALGHRKLAQDVSPNKTWEGFAGGVAVSTAVMAATGLWLLQQDRLSLAGYFVVVTGAAFLAMVSVVGDLFESMCKRQRGLKDSGNLLPGHGGMLDRIDSFTAATPLFMVLVMLAGKV